MRSKLILTLALLGLSALTNHAKAADSIDTRLVGVWRYTYTYTSGSFTMVEDQYLSLGEDGSVAMGFKRAGGTASASGTSGELKITNWGTWHVEGKVLYLKWKTGLNEEIPFIYGESFGKTKMMFKGGSKKLWTKIR